MNTTPFISVCIPAYRRVQYLKRLLESLEQQTYQHYEIVITDDTPGTEVQELLNSFRHLPVKYFKNPVALGTPENWNEGVRQAKGEWVKVMHDDDWFVSADSLATFARHITNNAQASFFFCAYQNVKEEDSSVQLMRVSDFNISMLRKDARYLLRENYVGNPSCTLFRKNGVVYDKRLKYVVDFEFYMRYLPSVNNAFVYIDTPLVNVGLNNSQVTTYTFRVNKVEIPENHLMLEQLGIQSLKKVVVYDYFWRLYRNLHIKNVQQVAEDGYSKPLAPVLKSMIGWQKTVPHKLLLIGAFSKCYMLLHYITHAPFINKKV